MMRHSIFSAFRLVLTVLALFLLTGGSHAAGEDYPSRPVRLLVAFPPGGTTDLLARIIAQKLGPRLGQPVVVENKPSAGGIVGTESIAKSPPDGLNLLMVPSLHGTNLSLYSKLPYDSVKDFTPIALVATSPYALVMNPKVPAKNVPELIAYLKKHPGEVNMSASAVGSPQHLAGELFKRSAGVDVVLVPYKGSGAILPDLMAGRVSLAFENQAVVAPHIKSGALKALAVTSAERSALLPDVPTMVESGVKDFVVIGWFGIMTAANTPADIVKRLNTEIRAVMQEPEVRQRLAGMGVTPLSGPPSELRDLLAREIDVWGNVIREANIRLD
jgi:tripartite-type tricarboxylate transporter receptor subunit TctC